MNTWNKWKVKEIENLIKEIEIWEKPNGNFRTKKKSSTAELGRVEKRITGLEGRIIEISQSKTIDCGIIELQGHLRL